MESALFTFFARRLSSQAAQVDLWTKEDDGSLQALAFA